MAIKIQHYVRTLRLKVKREGYAWLNMAAMEVNQVWLRSMRGRIGALKAAA